MGIVDKLAQAVTGKTKIERMQENAANKEIRRKANAAALREREKQAISFAEKRERKIYEERTKKLNKPKQSFFSYGNPFGQQKFSGKPYKVDSLINPSKKFDVLGW